METEESRGEGGRQMLGTWLRPRGQAWLLLALSQLSPGLDRAHRPTHCSEPVGKMG